MYAWHVKELNAISYKAVYFFNEPNWDNFTSHLDLGQYEDLHVRRVLMVEIAHGTVHYQHLCRGHFPKSSSSKKETRISQDMLCVRESLRQYANVGYWTMDIMIIGQVKPPGDWESCLCLWLAEFTLGDRIEPIIPSCIRHFFEPIMTTATALREYR